MEHPGRYRNHFFRPGAYSPDRADRVERLGLLFDDRSRTAAFGLPQRDDRPEVEQFSNQRLDGSGGIAQACDDERSCDHMTCMR